METRGGRMIQLLKDKRRLEELKGSNTPKYESTNGTSTVERQNAIEGTSYLLLALIMLIVLVMNGPQIFYCTRNSWNVKGNA